MIAKSTHTALFLTCLAILAVSHTAVSQNCGCAPHLCCSRWGYCGTGSAYCGQGCRQGPCYGTPTGGVDLAATVSQSFFNSIINQAGSWCAGKRFYTRNAFLAAANSFPSFKSSVTKFEIAAFFAHVTHETGHFCYIEEINGALRNYCQSSRLYPCAPGKKYHGRGPLQLTWNYNYGAAGAALGLPLLRNPELVAQNSVVSFKTALWFWTTNVRPVLGRGFGATIRAINGGECGGGNPGAVNARIRYFREYCAKLGVNPGANLSC